MRILHTADWHLGRTLEGRSRLDEQAAFLDELCDLVMAEAVQLVLVAGDIFDSVNPPAAAETLYYDALDRLSAGGCRGIVVIAGNHDNPDRLCAAGPLAHRQGITLLGLPGADPGIDPVRPGAAERVRRVAAGPGWLELAVPGCDHTVVIAALPYPSEARLGEVLAPATPEAAAARQLRFDDLIDATGPDLVETSEAHLRAAYSDRIARWFAELARRFRADAVALAMSHLYMQGGQESDSERPIQLGGAFTVAPAALPTGAQYVALGHLHRPQSVAGAGVPARYAGSPLAFSFHEAGQVKSVVLVDAVPGRAATVTEVPVTAGRPLAVWQATAGLDQVYTWCAEGRDPEAWIDLELHLPTFPTMDQIQELRRLRSRFVHIRPVLPAAAAELAAAGAVRAGMPLAELFRVFYARQTGGRAAPDAVVRLFLELSAGDGDGDGGGPVEGGVEP